MNIPNLIKNWKTTSAGVSAIAASIIHLVFCIKSGTANETAWESAIMGALVGAGLLFAGDASASADAKQQQALQAQMAVVPAAIDSGNTEVLKKTVADTTPTTKP